MDNGQWTIMVSALPTIKNALCSVSSVFHMPGLNNRWLGVHHFFGKWLFLFFLTHTNPSGDSMCYLPTIIIVNSPFSIVHLKRARETLALFMYQALSYLLFFLQLSPSPSFCTHSQQGNARCCNRCPYSVCVGPGKYIQCLLILQRL